ncbi:hypothetical protein M427DRAFT_31430 [Gonapodya prolifera JEL478]|uniref:Alpha/beta-hydrolase n=1 Tax=Gonapodya prolifera (strain JEL478) TaxID=1344416 RepID=A0A139AHH1_GONPJ|nr:hypothetical protein M427DRAFT_31430 [Gonapodya prolifera JEL478]|eukprot:KXS16271.1 hypothetical protein M427DRAFT_31430 [Gonapodya prolifera JEL478]
MDSIINTDSKISFLSADGKTSLSGILSVPPTQHSSALKHPALLFIAGSGPIDADGTAVGSLTPTLHINIQKHLSMELTKHFRLVTLRFDKRGIKGSAQSSDHNLFYKAGITELVSDIVGAYNFLASQETVDKDRIVLVGHSEGCMLIPATNKALTSTAPSAPPIFAAAFLSGLGDSLVNSTAYQRRTLAEEIKTAHGLGAFIMRRVYGADPQANMEEKAQEQFKTFRESKDDYSSALFGFVKTPVKWWREHLDYQIPGKLQEDYAAIRFHVFGATGDYDIQVDPKTLDQDMHALMPLAPSIQVHRVPKVSHILRECDYPNTFQNMKAELPEQCKRPLSAEVVNLLGKWIEDVVVIKGKHE